MSKGKGKEPDCEWERATAVAGPKKGQGEYGEAVLLGRAQEPGQKAPQLMGSLICE